MIQPADIGLQQHSVEGDFGSSHFSLLPWGKTPDVGTLMVPLWGKAEAVGVFLMLPLEKVVAVAGCPSANL